jgi:hypothetical protein
MAQKPIAKFTETTHDFGVISGDKKEVSTKFEFTNTGQAPLLITNVTASCGCTTPKWNKAPVPPGGKGVIIVGFKPKGSVGFVEKTITVTNNSPENKIVLKIKGEVLPKDKKDKKDKNEKKTN